MTGIFIFNWINDKINNIFLKTTRINKPYVQNTTDEVVKPMKKNNNKDKIISVAVNLFTSIGYDKVTVNQIIEASNTSKGTFYHYFEAKNELLGYILDIHDEELKALLLTLPNDMTLLEKVKELVSCVLRTHYNANDEIATENVKQIYKSQLDLPDHKKFLLNEDRYIFKIFYELVDAAIDKGEIQDEFTSKEVVRTIMLMLRGVMFNWYLSGTRFNLIDKGTYLINLYIDDISKF